MSTRRYHDPCGIARALDVVGDRWALLIVRELIFGPKRFVQLRHGLHGVSPNVMSQRLLGLEDAGVVRREMLDPPADIAIYELTPRGRALEPILLELGRWGSQEPAATDATFALGIDGDWFGVMVISGSIDITHGRTEHPAVTFETDVATFRSVAFGREPITEAERDGRLTVLGNRYLAERFARMFPSPMTSGDNIPR